MKRLRLYSREWICIWDSQSEPPLPAYAMLLPGQMVGATIDYAKNIRWCGFLTRTPHGVERENMQELEKLISWPWSNPFLPEGN